MATGENEGEQVNTIGKTSRGKILLELSQAEYDSILLAKKRTESSDLPDECYMVNPLQVPETLKQLRNFHGISQPDVAEFMKRSSVSTVSHYETGARKMDMEKIERFANALGYDVQVAFTKQVDEAVCGCGYTIVRIDGVWEHVDVPGELGMRHLPMPKKVNP